MMTEPLSRTSALPDTGEDNRPAASMLNSVGMFWRSTGDGGAVALISNLSGYSPVRALPAMRILRSADIVKSAFMPSMRFSTRSRKFANTTVPPVTITCSMLKGSLVPTVFDGAAVSRTRSRCSGRFRTGRTITSSVISGLPDHRLDSVTSASMLAAVRRLLMSRSLGSDSVTSFIVTFNDGHSPTLVDPLIASL